jgi:hypothetical protein
MDGTDEIAILPKMTRNPLRVTGCNGCMTALLGIPDCPLMKVGGSKADVATSTLRSKREQPMLGPE